MSDYRNDVVLSVICPRCGEIDLTTDQVWLVIASAPDRSLYRFRCTGCQQPVSHRADDAVVAVLTELVAVEELEIPEEALEQHDGPPLDGGRLPRREGGPAWVSPVSARRVRASRSCRRLILR